MLENPNIDIMFLNRINRLETPKSQMDNIVSENKVDFNKNKNSSEVKFVRDNNIDLDENMAIIQQMRDDWNIHKKFSVVKIDGKKEKKAETFHTLAFLKADIEGLEDYIFYGGSPNVINTAKKTNPLLLPLNHLIPDDEREIKAPFNNFAFINHAEEYVINLFNLKAKELMKESNLTEEDIKGTVYIHQSNNDGVCWKCFSGIKDSTADSGVIKQISEKYPNVTFVVTSDGEKPTQRGAGGERFFKVQNGVLVDENKG